MRQFLVFPVGAGAPAAASSSSIGLDERQANEVESVLESAGIAADKVAEDNGANAYKIVVPRAEAGRAFSLLEARDLPRRALRGLSDTFAGGTLLPSPVEDRARYAAALGVELERSLEEIPGVVSARVHLALPPRSRSSATPRTARPTASVLLKTRARSPSATATSSGSSPAPCTASPPPTSASSSPAPPSTATRRPTTTSVRCGSPTSRAR